MSCALADSPLPNMPRPLPTPPLPKSPLAVCHPQSRKTYPPRPRSHSCPSSFDLANKPLWRQAQALVVTDNRDGQWEAFNNLWFTGRIRELKREVEEGRVSEVYLENEQAEVASEWAREGEMVENYAKEYKRIAGMEEEEAVNLLEELGPARRGEEKIERAERLQREFYRVKNELDLLKTQHAIVELGFDEVRKAHEDAAGINTRYEQDVRNDRLRMRVMENAINWLRTELLKSEKARKEFEEGKEDEEFVRGIKLMQLNRCFFCEQRERLEVSGNADRDAREEFKRPETEERRIHIAGNT